LAAELSPNKNYQLSDPRIQAVFAINPISSSIFGERELNKITVPVTFVMGSEDIITPALLEQIQPFTWLKSYHKYLIAIDKGSHFYGGLESFNFVNLSQNNLTIKSSRKHLQAMSLGFMQNYIAKSDRYRIFMSSKYANYLSQNNLKLNLIYSLDETSFNLSDR
jgi:predicted dienelactone hydrolase